MTARAIGAKLEAALQTAPYTPPALERVDLMFLRGLLYTVIGELEERPGRDPAKTERNEQIWRERQAGDSYTVIGPRHGISAHRARPICIQFEGREYARACGRAVDAGEGEAIDD